MTWDNYRRNVLTLSALDFQLDSSRLGMPEGFIAGMAPSVARAFADMAALEKGAIANPDEKRMVGHYWLRAPRLAPDAALTKAVEDCVARIREFTAKVHSGAIQGQGGQFRNLLVIGIGGSALGPQFVSQALGGAGVSRMRVAYLDNTDPEGIDGTLRSLGGELGRTLALVISKSGGTPETRNGMLEAEHAWAAAGFDFARHAVAVTGEGSQLDKHAVAKGWITRFPMWDWVGGRTSETGPVGLLPAALEGLDIARFLEGAAAMDAATRVADAAANPAMRLALCWHFATEGKGAKDMVVLPYKDKLSLFAKYLQQLIMESIGKELDLQGRVVRQGISVYGNKGSTDQHAYVQQLREGVANFFATFIEVLEDRQGASIEVEPGITSGDYLEGFLLGTREALTEKGRGSITITIRRVDAFSVGMLIALYERATGFYASLVGINAYHQPGVEAGKKAAAGYLKLNSRIQAHLAATAPKAQSAEEVAAALGEPSVEVVFKLLEHLAANPSKGVSKQAGITPFDGRYFGKAADK